MSRSLPLTTSIDRSSRRRDPGGPAAGLGGPDAPHGRRWETRGSGRHCYLGSTLVEWGQPVGSPHVQGGRFPSPSWQLSWPGLPPSSEEVKLEASLADELGDSLLDSGMGERWCLWGGPLQRMQGHLGWTPSKKKKTSRSGRRRI